jgi:branched-chain amino acid transport system permease protein
MAGGRTQLLGASAVPSVPADGWRRVGGFFAVAAYLVLTFFVAQSSLGMQSLVLVAAVFGILAISLDLVAGMLGLYSLGQAGFFAIRAYLTAIAAADYDADPFYLLPVVLLVTTLAGILIGATSLRVSGLYFAITTFVFTLVLTVLATDLKITRGTQGLLGPTLPDFPEPLDFLGTPVAWCVMISLLLALLLASSIRNSPLYPILLSIRDAEPFAQAAGVRTSAIKIGVFGLSAAMAGIAGWLFAFFGVVSPGQFDWAVSLNILVMVLVGGINTTRFLPSGTVISQTLTGKSARGGSFPSLKIGPGSARTCIANGSPSAARIGQLESLETMTRILASRPGPTSCTQAASVFA